MHDYGITKALLLLDNPLTTRAEGLILDFSRLLREKMSEVSARLAYLWVAANCKCVMRRCRSANHVDCFRIDPWIVEQIQECDRYTSMSNNQNRHSRSPNFSESLDSLQTDSPMFSLFTKQRHAHYL
ncbi:hypothetical protein QR680_001872 [Steinernema hermaphroditum]|uniref:Uncharacterized protein n=1 Tax=Steinernema hermaphroditum TaxID=289476 RepID=A0AA39H319_9BILA|nr:hypothetical protein QR680_001872 [Steinernema hermaphroditum]